MTSPDVADVEPRADRRSTVYRSLATGFDAVPRLRLCGKCNTQAFEKEVWSVEHDTWFLVHLPRHARGK